MMNNGPFFPKFLKKSLFTSFPDDLRPSRFAAFMAAFGHVSEVSVPFILLFAAQTGNEWILLGGCILFTGFHGFIGLNNPNGMPVEWNILMIYGGWFLFWFHPEASVFDMTQMPVLLGAMLFSLVAVPLYGNLFPAHVSWIGFRRGGLLRKYQLDFMQLFAPHLTRRLIERAAAAATQADVEELAAGLELPLR